MIPKTCETCEQHRCYQRHANKPCHDWSPDLGHWDAKIAALEAEVARLEARLSGGCISGLEEVLEEARKELDDARAESARARADVAPLESELGGLRHSLADVECELEDAKKERDEARAAAMVTRADAEQERDRLQKRVHALEDQIEHAGCAAAHEGERTYECRIEAPCGLCRLRARAEAAEARVRELEADCGKRLAEEAEARERRLMALGFETPGPGAYTCGDALGLRRLEEVETTFPDPDVDNLR